VTDPQASIRPLRLAHRGDSRKAPENTLEALAAALEIPGCDGVEFDIRLSRDGVPMLFHDQTTRRVLSRPGRFDRLTAAVLAELGVPELATVLRVLPPTAFLDIELKGIGHGDATAAVLRGGRGDNPPRAVISSFEAATLSAMAEQLPGWPRWLNTHQIGPASIAAAAELGCRVVAVSWQAITPASMEAARAAGLEVAAYTVRRRANCARLARLGVMAACVEGAALDG
jgi:glycerophosphoryl diester phosphodiesterase